VPHADSATGGALEGIRVLAFEHAWAGPYGTMMLADMGADVVRVEPPGVGDHVRLWTGPQLAGLSPHFLAANRNKRSVVLDLKAPDGLATARRLAAEADVVLENFAPGALRRLGLDAATLRGTDPALIYCSVSGFGQRGPYAARRAYDLLVQAESGIMAVTGQDKHTLAKVGVPIVDVMAGMVGAFAVVSAILRRQQTGEGATIDLAMLDIAASVMSFNLLTFGLSGTMPEPMGTAHPLLAPYEVLQAGDGPMAIAILTEEHWHTFCDLLQRPDLLQDPDFATAPSRRLNRDRLNAVLNDELASWTCAALTSVLEDAGLAFGRVNDVAALLEHEQLEYRDFYEEWELDGRRLKAAGAPWLPGATATRNLPPAVPGQDTDEVLAEWLGD
jgi:crotonobetainyl-CoA:carnitine CoA-transferase CaiB-like acyl-CoA transferase